MSEQILQALTKLFALITKQDGGATEVERKFVIDYFVQELDHDSVQIYTNLYDNEAEYGKAQENKLITMKDSVRILKFCRQINKSLEQRQKVIILVKLLELVASDKNFTSQRRMIIDTVSSAFNIKDDYSVIESFVLSEDSTKLNDPNILVASNNNLLVPPEAKHYPLANLHGEVIFIRVSSVDLYFIKYVGNDDVRLNGFTMKRNQVYLFSNGGSIKTEKGASLYYGDVTSVYLHNLQDVKLSFTAQDIVFRFPNGHIGIQKTSLSETQGKLVGIMGGCGAGKTTLMNVLSGIESPSDGQVLINGINLHSSRTEIEGVIGYVAQDDLLIEELTVYQNLYYNAKLCFGGLSEEDIDSKVMTTLESLGLDHIRDLKVGNVLNKKISGGQRKRLNIALELIREPAVLFVDEPTSGLSSKDSQNVIDLLKELSLKGKLIFVVIHQPSSDIYKSFDKMIILDRGGYLIFYGNPLEAIAYFKEQTNQADSQKYSENPEEMFNLIEKEVVNEFGEETGKRQLSPKQWHERFLANFAIEEAEVISDPPPSSVSRPNIFKQAFLFTTRDFLSKISNRQYMLINLLEAPLLALMLSYIIRFQNEPGTGEYVYRFNDNIPAYILICIIISLFMGLTVSAEEIIKDLKIQKRERFLNLSRFSYLSSKIIILFLLSAIQTFSFVIIGNFVLEIQGELISYWAILFSVSCFANVLGLNISSMFNSVITIYITIPLLLIPQMILSGIIFRFEKMNTMISEKGTVPLLADFMTSRWAFEAIMVDQFKHNHYEVDFYDVDKRLSESNFKVTFWIPELSFRLEKTLEMQTLDEKSDSIDTEIDKNLKLIRSEIKTKNAFPELLEGIDLENDLLRENFNEPIAGLIRTYFDSISQRFTNLLNESGLEKDEIIEDKSAQDDNYDLNEFKNRYFNESQAVFVSNANVLERIEEQNGKLLQMIDPVFMDPPKHENPLNYRSHFMAPRKPFMGTTFGTYYFNMGVIWFFTFVLYLTLYFDLFKRLIVFLNNIGKKE